MPSVVSGLSVLPNITTDLPWEFRWCSVLGMMTLPPCKTQQRWTTTQVWATLVWNWGRAFRLSAQLGSSIIRREVCCLAQPAQLP